MLFQFFLLGFLLQQPAQKQADPNAVISMIGDQLKQKTIESAICININEQLTKENEQLRKEIAALKEEKK